MIKEILEAEIPISLSHLRSYVDFCLSYAHFLVSKMCHEYWHSYSNTGGYETNEFVDVSIVIWDWRGRCFSKPGFGGQQKYLENMLQIIGAPLLKHSKVLSNDGSKAFDVGGAY